MSVFGTPAEERGGGKIQMLQDGCFDDVDMVLMSHPMRYEIPRPTYLAKCEFNVKFRGINLTDIYLFRVNNVNTWTITEICSKVIKSPERSCSGVFYQIWTDFTHCSAVSILAYGHVNIQGLN